MLFIRYPCFASDGQGIERKDLLYKWTPSLESVCEPITIPFRPHGYPRTIVINLTHINRLYKYENTLSRMLFERY